MKWFQPPRPSRPCWSQPRLWRRFDPPASLCSSHQGLRKVPSTSSIRRIKRSSTPSPCTEHSRTWIKWDKSSSGSVYLTTRFILEANKSNIFEPAMELNLVGYIFSDNMLGKQFWLFCYYVGLKWNTFLKNRPFPSSFSFIFVFSNKQYNFYNK